MKYSLYFVYTAQKRQTLINRICRSFFLNVVLSGHKNTLWENREAAMWYKAKNLSLWWRFTDSLTIVADPSHSLRMTINVSLIMTPFPPIVVLSGRKNALWESREAVMWHWAKNLLLWWRLTGFCITVTASSLWTPFLISLILSSCPEGSFCTTFPTGGQSYRHQ